MQIAESVSVNVLLIGTTEPDNFGSRLPSNLQVLQFMFYNLKLWKSILCIKQRMNSFMVQSCHRQNEMKAKKILHKHNFIQKKS